MNIGDCIKELKTGQVMRRKNWNGKGQHISIREPDNENLMTLPYIYIYTVQGDLVPWLASQTDILAEDWEFAT